MPLSQNTSPIWSFRLESLSATPSAAVQQEMKRLQRPFGGKICIGPEGSMQVGERGPLEGSGSWTHQNQTRPIRSAATTR